LAIRWTSLSTDPAQSLLVEGLANETISLCNQLVELGGY
jgi:hypothetical protein